MLGSLRQLTVEESEHRLFTKCPTARHSSKQFHAACSPLVREYHGRTYLPNNVCLHIDGSIPLPKLLDILNNKIDPLILSRSNGKPTANPAGWKRPFLETTSKDGPVIKKSSKEVVEFMDKDESAGEMQIVWRGPQTGDGFEEAVSTCCRTGLNIPTE